MKKKILCIFLAFVLSAALFGCGNEKTPAPASAVPEQAAAEEAPVEDPAAAEESSKEEKPQEIKDAVTGESLAMHNEAVILHTDTTVEKENEYRIEGMYSELLTDRAIDRGWEYYYFDSLESSAVSFDRECTEGTFTSIEIILFVKNMSDSPVKFGDSANITVVFDEGGVAKTYAGTVLQYNPGQTDQYGNAGPSLKYADIGPDESTQINFLTDIDREMHDKLVEDEAREPAWAYIELANGDRYCVDLREEMVLFGYDASDPESMITCDVHRTMKAATSPEFMEEFLNGNEFKQIAEMAQIDVKEAAEKYASLFSIKVTDITFESDTSATAYCTVISPDFIQMYRNLEEKGSEMTADIDPAEITQEEFYRMYGQLLLDYTQDEEFPFITTEITIPYQQQDVESRWIPLDREQAEGEMRVALLNF